MYRNILIPIAFEDETDFATPLGVARRLAKDGARITLMHVFEVPPAYVMTYVPEDLMQATRDGVLDSLQSAAEDVPGAEALILDGSPGRTITDWAEKNGVELIVMASHRPELGDILWGSTAGFVVRHAVCAVHVLR